MKYLRFFLALLIVSASLLLAAPACSPDWPQFRGPKGSGVATTAVPVNLGQKNLLWKTPIPGPGASSPSIIGNRVYVTCFSGYAVPGQSGGNLQQLKRHLICLDRQTGKTSWTHAVPAKLPEESSIREHGYAANTPVADSERVYAFFGKSGVHAFDHRGRSLWHADVGSNTHGWGSAASPMLWGDLLIVNASVESASLVALNKKTGREVWRAQGIRDSWNTPIVVTLLNRKPELVLAIMGKVLGFDPATGKQLWSCATDIAWYMVPSLVAQHDMVFCIGGRTGGILAVKAGGRGEVTQTHRKWTGRKGSNVSSPIVHQGHLYWAHENLGVIYCADAATGKMVYEERLPRAGQIYASPVLAGGKLYYLTRNGRLLVVPAKPSFEPPVVSDLGDGSMFNASPTVAGGRFFVRSDRFLYCYGGK